VASGCWFIGFVYAFLVDNAFDQAGVSGEPPSDYSDGIASPKGLCHKNNRP
jgi:hypothetical protein